MARLSKGMPKAPDPKDESTHTPGKFRSGGVTLPPIDATPEEIARALFQRPPLKGPKPKMEDDKKP